MSNSLDPDQAPHCVGPDLGPNCLQKLSAAPLVGKVTKLFACWVIFRDFFVIICSNFSTSIFSKYSVGNSITVLNSWDPDQARHCVGSDLGPECLQRSFTDDKGQCQQGKS